MREFRAMLLREKTTYDLGYSIGHSVTIIVKTDTVKITDFYRRDIPSIIRQRPDKSIDFLNRVLSTTPRRKHF